MKRITLFVAIIVTLLTLLVSNLAAQDTTTADTALVEQGRYLAYIAGCVSCHSPYKAEYADFSTLTPEQLADVGLRALETLDVENRGFSGGRPFDLGPAGVVYSANLTSDPATGLGNWTDAEIETAIRIGVSRDGVRLHPIMPYLSYYNMAKNDMQALIAFLRTLPPIENAVTDTGVTGEGIAPELPPATNVVETAPTEPLERGAYLMNTIMVCADCHTPLDPTTGAPIAEKRMAGGQPYEGPWGIVYGGNITPHQETGLGKWTAADFRRVFREGVRIDGRRLVLMPWEDYAVATDADLDALVLYLQQGLQPIENVVPANALTEPFIQVVELASPATQSAPDNTALLLVIGVAVVVVIGVGATMLMRSRKAS